jgi:AcrR family transcriptional regulator
MLGAKPLRGLDTSEQLGAMARTRSENYEDIQLGILANAARLFATQGYERTSIGDLADACKLSRGALYHYFQSKEAILYAMLETHVRGMLKRLNDAVALTSGASEQLASLVEAAVEYNSSSRNEQVVLLNDLPSLGEREQKVIKALERQIVERVSQVLAGVDTRGKITPATRKVYTMALLGTINYIYTWYDPQGSVKPKQYARMATDLFLNGFLAASDVAQDASVVPLRRRAASRR